MRANAGRIGCFGVPYGTMRTELVGQLGVEVLCIWGVLVRGGTAIGGGGKAPGRRAWHPAKNWPVGVERPRLSFKRRA